MSKLLDVAEGVNYLHTCHMFHGDLKGVSLLFPRKGQPKRSLTFSKPNILIDGSGHARVSDFGLASIAYGAYSTGVKSNKGHTVRWSAPEVLFGAVPASKQADMFSFGMVVVEVRHAAVREHNDVRCQVPFFRRRSLGKFLSTIQFPRRLPIKL